MSTAKETSAPKRTTTFAPQDTMRDLGSDGHSEDPEVPDAMHDPDLEFESPPRKVTEAKETSAPKPSTGNPRKSRVARRTTSSPRTSAELSSESELREEAEPQQEPFTSVSPPSVNSWSSAPSSGANATWTPTLDPTGQFSSSGPSNAGPNTSSSGTFTVTPPQAKSPFRQCLRAPQTLL